MGKSRKGGYKLVSLNHDELTTMTALAGLYASIVNSHKKPLMLSDIVINGEKKNDIYVTAVKGTNKYTISGIYGYKLEVTNADAVTITAQVDTSAWAQSLQDKIVANGNNVEIGGRTEVEDLYVSGDVVDSEGNDAINIGTADISIAKNVNVGEVANPKNLYVSGEASDKKGKFVHVMDAPSSTTLTDEQIDIIKEGVFINGTFLDFINPIISPARVVGDVYRGFILGENGNDFQKGLYEYVINANKVISKGTQLFTADTYGVAGGTQGYILGKRMGRYPSDTPDKTYVLKLINGVLTWVEEQA